MSEGMTEEHGKRHHLVHSATLYKLCLGFWAIGLITGWLAGHVW